MDADLQRKTQAAALRALADDWERGTHGCLTLADLGTVFGNDFWLLLQDAQPSAITLYRAHAYAGLIARHASDQVLNSILMAVFGTPPGETLARGEQAARHLAKMAMMFADAIMKESHDG